MTKYTAADFANARFAEHPDGRIAARLDPTEACPWEAALGYYNDADLARDGWVPVTTKPTITESEYREIRDDNYATGGSLRDAFESAGIEVIPDPEPTNTERIAAIITEKFQLEYRGDPNDALGIAKYLNDYGVTAPDVKDN